MSLDIFDEESNFCKFTSFPYESFLKFLAWSILMVRLFKLNNFNRCYSRINIKSRHNDSLNKADIKHFDESQSLKTVQTAKISSYICVLSILLTSMHLMV